MKKIYFISALTVMFGFVFTLKPDWFTFFWGWQIILLPLVAGVLMVLVQNEDKSYQFMPKLIVGSIVTSLTFIVIWQIVAFQPGNTLYISEALSTVAFLAAIIIFGGLIGLVIRGVTLLTKKYDTDKQKN